MDVLTSVFGFGRRFSGAAHSPSDRNEPIDPADVHPADLEAGTAPSSPIGVQPNIDIANDHRVVSKTEVLFDQSEVDPNELSSSPIRYLSVHGKEQDAPSIAPPVPSDRRHAVRMAAPPHHKKLAPPPYTYSERGLVGIELEGQEIDSEQQGVRFMPRSQQNGTVQREPTRCSIPKAYWQDLAPETDLLRRATHHILSHGSNERVQHRARILASATDAARAELVVLANSMLVDVVRAQNLIIEALRLPEDHPTRNHIIEDKTHPRNPNDLVPQLKRMPYEPEQGDGVRFVGFPPPNKGFKATDDKAWLKLLANDPGPTLPGNPDDAAISTPSCVSWVPTDPEKIWPSRRGAEAVEQLRSPDPLLKGKGIPRAHVPSNLRRPKENQNWGPPKAQKTDGSFEAAIIHGINAVPRIADAVETGPGIQPRTNCEPGKDNGHDDGEGRDTDIQSFVSCQKPLGQVSTHSNGTNLHGCKATHQRLAESASRHLPYLLGLDGAMDMSRDAAIMSGSTHDKAKERNEAQDAPEGDSQDERNGRKGRHKKLPESSQIVKGDPDDRALKEKYRENPDTDVIKEAVGRRLQQDLADDLRRIYQEPFLPDKGNRSNGQGENDQCDEFAGHHIQDDPFASQHSDSFERSVEKRAGSSGRRRKPVGKTLADEGFLSWHGD